MTASDSTPEMRDDELAAVLASLDEALAAGDDSLVAQLTARYPEAAVAIDRSRECLQLLQQLRPSHASPPPCLPTPPVSSLPVSLPTHFGRFRIRGLIGSGGFGIVYLAHDAQLNRDVALKVPRFEMLLPAAMRDRFQREARAGAGLDHPNVAAVYDAGEVLGVSYIASAYCPGRTLAQWIAEQRQPIECEAASSLLQLLADAVDHGHRRGVLHRDLKPQNVLLIPIVQQSAGDEVPANCFRAAGRLWQPKITDFGLARLTFEHVQTADATALGTPAYMAPEQTGRGTSSAGTDVYGLGAILYELLTGRPPFTAESPLDVMDQVRSREVLPPSRLRPRVPRDLETICVKCLEKEPRRRYATARALYDDLQRFRMGQPIRARSVTAPERALKWVFRRPILAGLLLLIVLLTGFGIAALSWAWLGSIEKQRLAAESLRRSQAQLYAHKIVLAHNAWESNQYELVRRLLDECAVDRRNWEWFYLDGLVHSELLQLRVAPAANHRLAIGPRGQWMACSGSQDELQIHDLRTRELVRTLDAGDPELSVWDIDCDPTGRWLACAWQRRAPFFRLAATNDERPERMAVLRILDLVSGELVLDYAHSGSINCLDLAPGIARIAWAGAAGTIHVWDLDSGTFSRRLVGHTSGVMSVAFTSDGRQLISASVDETIRIWDLATGRNTAVLRAHRGGVMALAVAPRRKVFASVGMDQTLRLWSTATHRDLHVIRWPTSPIWSLDFSDDGRLVAAADNEGRIGIWDVDSGQLSNIIHSHSGNVTAACFRPESRQLASIGRDSGKGNERRYALKLWDARHPHHHAVLECSGSAISRDGRWCVQIDGLNPFHFRNIRHLQLCELASGRVRWTSNYQDTSAYLFSGDGNCLALLVGRTVRLLESASGKLLTKWELPARTFVPRDGPESADEQPLRLALDQCGQRLAVAGSQGNLIVFDRQGERRWEGPVRTVRQLLFNHDGSRLVAVLPHGTVEIWELLTGASTTITSPESMEIARVALSPDGEYVAVSYGEFSTKSSVRIWSLTTRQLCGSLIGHTDVVSALAFSADSRRLVTGSRDETVRVWDVADGCELLTFRPKSGAIWHVAFCRDGRKLLAASGRRRVDVWRAGDGSFAELAE
jgi:eukaryotic-like serine/threonine-protein kinase